MYNNNVFIIYCLLRMYVHMYIVSCGLAMQDYICMYVCMYNVHTGTYVHVILTANKNTSGVKKWRGQD